MAPVAIENKLNKAIAVVVKGLDMDKGVLSQTEATTYSEFLMNKMLMIGVIRAGVPYSLFELIQDATPFTDNYWADVLDISTKSLHRYKQESRSFRPIQSEKIIELAEVTNVGLDVFGDMERLKLWLETPNFALGSLKPIELLKDSYGKELVLSELTRINYGILA